MTLNEQIDQLETCMEKITTDSDYCVALSRIAKEISRNARRNTLRREVITAHLPCANPKRSPLIPPPPLWAIAAMLILWGPAIFDAVTRLAR